MGSWRRIICQRDCPDACGLLARVEGGSVVEVRGDPEHPITRGYACPKAKRFPNLYFGDGRKRVLYPHVRDGGEFRRVSWDEAISIVAEKLRSVLSEHGPAEVVAYGYAGSTGLLAYHYPLRLFNSIGAVRIEHTICDEAGEEALSLHYGMRYGAFPEDLERAELVVVWGANLASSSVHAHRLVAEVGAKGRPVWVVDPRKTPTAALGRHVRPRPGTDVPLALGVSWVIVNELEPDREFIQEFTSGFDRYAELISRYPPERVESITGVPARVQRELAADYRERRPSVTYIGVAVQKARYGAEAVRAISLIPALVGIHRGFFFCNSTRDFDTAYLEGRGLGQPADVVNMLDVGRLLASGRFKFLYVYGANPARTAPRADLFRRGLQREDLFVVVHDVFWTDTARLADVVLPATSMFEHLDMVASWWHPYVGLSEPAVDPLGECRPNWWVVTRIAEALGIDHPWVRERPEEALERVLQSSEMLPEGMNALRRGGVVRLRYPPKDRYQTPSGRVEFWSSLAEGRGLSPLPVDAWEEPPEGFPVRLLTSSVPLVTSTQDELDSMDQVHVSPEDALKFGLADGDLAVLESSAGGRAVARVRVDRSLPAAVAWVRRSGRLAEGFVNDLVSSEKQAIGGGNTFNSTYVRLRPLSPSA